MLDEIVDERPRRVGRERVGAEKGAREKKTQKRVGRKGLRYPSDDGSVMCVGSVCPTRDVGGVERAHVERKYSTLGEGRLVRSTPLSRNKNVCKT